MSHENKTYVYRLRLTEKLHDPKAWDAAVMKHFEAHSDYLMKAASEGVAQVIGRTDVELKDNFGIVVFTASDEESAHEFMIHDPAVEHGLMTAELFPFRLVYKS
jgi:uncharacterized protein